MKKKTSPFRYSTGLFALTLLTQLFHGFSYTYYVDQAALITINLATLSKIIFVIVDGVNDVIFSALSEKTRSRWGKRLPWLVTCMPFLALSVILTYAVSPETGFSTIQFFVFYLFISITFENFSTIMYTNYYALYPVLFVEEKERSKVSSIRHIGELLGMAICLVASPYLVELIGYIGLGIIYGIIYMAIMIYCVTGINYKQAEDTVNTKPYSFRQTIKDAFTNKAFLIYNIAVSFNQACLGVLVTIYPLYAKYVLKVNSLEQGILMGILFVAVIISVPLWYKAMQRWGYRKCWKISYIIFPFLLAALAIPYNFISGIIVVAVVGPGVGGIMITPDLMGAEIIDMDKKKNGISREASFLSMGSVLQRLSVAISAIFMSLVSSLFGYVDGNNPGPNPDLTFRVVTGAMLPIIGLLGSICAVIYIYLSKKDFDKITNNLYVDKN